MSNIAISIEGLGKKYRIGQNHGGYRTFRETLTSAASRLGKAFCRDSSNDPGDFWALQDVSLEIKHGEIVGLIGRNGAGKSTLLKILSRITSPTTGGVQLHGRLGSLLEVGTGFHPELTGRENIYLNGAILGMSRQEISQRFDEIINFAGIDNFLDTPVKRYSSGMQLKLGFSVAAHLEPEIMLVDEVLAVGDVAFQRKCLQKMRDVATTGRTVLLVSHNMAAVMNLCRRGIVLDGGRLAADMGVERAVAHYMALAEGAAEKTLGDRVDRKGDQALRFHSYSMLNAVGEGITHAFCGQEIQLAFQYTTSGRRSLGDIQVDIGVHGNYDQPLFHLSTKTSGNGIAPAGLSGELRCVIPRLPLQPGKYTFNLYCTVGGEIADWVQAAGHIEVVSGDFFGTGRLPPPGQGVLLVPHRWAVHDFKERTEVCA